MSTGFSRLPVYEDDLDNIVGVLNQKDFHNYIKGTDVPVSSYVKPVIFVAGSMKISQLLKKLQLGKTHITSFSQETKMSDSAAIYVSFFLDPTNEQINAYIDRVYAGAPGSYSDHFGYTITKDARRSAAYLESLGYSFDLPAE